MSRPDDARDPRGSRRVEINPGEPFLLAPRIVLAERYESILGLASKIGTVENDQIVYMFTFTGRENNSTREASFTVALSPEDALQLTTDILAGLELLVSIQDGGQS